MTRHTHLKVKIKTLAAEARIIRIEERRAHTPEARMGLADHRKGIVRHVARHALLAYGFLRGMKYHRMEARCTPGYEPDWAQVAKVAKRFGGAWDQDVFDEWKGDEPVALDEAA